MVLDDPKLQELYEYTRKDYDEGVYEAINLDVCVSQRKSAGGPAKENTLANVARIRSTMEE